MMGFGMMGGGIFGLLTIGVIVYLLVRDNHYNTNESNYNRSNDALEILKERYVKEEISEVEYERMKNTLMN